MPAAGPVLENEPFPLTITENYKVIGDIDDVKPAITAMSEFTLVDHGSSLFELASGCILHRDPTSGKVKFLPLGRWKGTLCQEDLPVNYIAISEHLDMVGVVLKATHTQTRMANCDMLLDKVKHTIGPWKGGKFMPLSLRCHSVNTYCLPKVWFKCGSMDLRAGDISKINSYVKSWVYADQLVKPEEIVMYKCRQEGGMNLVNVKYRAMAELIKSFLDTAISPTFKRSIFHQALYEWHVDGNRSIPNPGKPGYYSCEFFDAIRAVKAEGLLRLSGMSIGMWYRALLERYVTHEVDENSFQFKMLSKTERINPNTNWESTWQLSTLPGLDSMDTSFLFCLLHNLLPTQERLHRVLSTTVTSSHCTLCTQDVICDQLHALVHCPFNNGVGYWTIRCLRFILPQLQPVQLMTMNFGLDPSSKNALPASWFAAKALNIVWQSRVSKKVTSITATRAALEASIMLLRKTRFLSSANTLENLITVS